MGKTCKHCGVEKPLDLFQKHPRAKHGRTNKCRVCATAEEVLRYKKNHRSIREQRNSHYATNKEQLREKIYEWRKANPDSHKAAAQKWASKNKERKNSYERERYAKSERMRIMAAERCRRYQASKKQATPRWASIPAMRVLYAKSKEWSRITGQEWHVDHIVPILSKNVCGLHVPANLQLLAGAINISKLNRAWPDMP
jgi:hypothetical protein